MASVGEDRLSISLLTREYPPSIYGGAGVHVAQLVPQLRKLIDVDVQCMGEPREGATAHAENYPAGANAALRVFGADLSMTAAISDVNLVHSQPGRQPGRHLAGLRTRPPRCDCPLPQPHRRGMPHSCAAATAFLVGRAHRFEAADAVISVSAGMRAPS